MRAPIVLCVLLLLTAGAWGEPLVRNGDFHQGGRMWVAGWRPLPGDTRIRRVIDESRPYLHLKLREDCDGGLMQRVALPAGRRLSLRLLATAWETPGGGVVATLVRCDDGVVLCELLVDGIKRGVVARNFDTGPGGAAELTLRLVGDPGTEGAVDSIAIAEPLPETRDASVAYGPATQDLVLGPGEGLAFVVPNHPVIRAAAEMAAGALADLGALPVTRPGAEVRVTMSEAGGSHWPASESYHLSVRAGRVTVQAAGAAGAAWGLMSLSDLMRAEPGGGVRVLSAEVEDAPELPWRAGWVSGPASQARNAVRRLARLKLNVALIPATTHSQGEGDWEVIGREACEAALAHGLEPVAVLHCIGEAGADGLALAVETVARNLPVSRLMINFPGAWRAEPGDAILAAAGAARPLIIISMLDGAGRLPEQTAEALRTWPSEVVAVCGHDLLGQPAVAEALEHAGARGLSYLLAVEGDAPAAARAALQARVRGRACLGLVAPADDPEPTANAAWRVPR